MKTGTALALCLVFGLSIAARDAHAALLLIDHTGATPELLGATGVSVNGTLYDVTFIDGSCVALFDGCDAPADFAFTLQLDAEAAAQARWASPSTRDPLGSAPPGSGAGPCGSRLAREPDQPSRVA